MKIYYGRIMEKGENRILDALNPMKNRHKLTKVRHQNPVKSGIS